MIQPYALPRRDRAVPLNELATQTLTTTQHIMRNGDKKWVPPNEPLFRFGAPRDLVQQMVNVKDRVLFKVFTNLVEIIVMKGADEYDLAMAMWLVSHMEGHLFANLPTKDDPKRLTLLTNVTKESRVSDLVSKIVGTLIKYPAHFVLQTKFSTRKSVLVRPELQNLEAINEIYEKVKTDYTENKI